MKKKDLDIQRCLNSRIDSGSKHLISFLLVLLETLTEEGILEIFLFLYDMSVKTPEVNFVIFFSVFLTIIEFISYFSYIAQISPSFW